MLGSVKAALAAAATSIKSALPTVVAATTATVLAGGCIYYYTIKDGIYEKSASNVRYVLEQYMSQISINSIVENGRGGYAYTTNLDEMADEILLKLKEAKSSISSYTGQGNEKEFITKLIKAELITQYPDLRSADEIKNSSEIPENEVQGGIKIVRSDSGVEVAEVDTENIPEYVFQDKNVLTYKPYNEFKQLIESGDTSAKNYYSLKSSALSSSVSGNFVVKTDETNCAPVLTREQVESAILNTYDGDAENNLIGALDAFMKIQEEQKVNAIFAIAVTQAESSCGTNWSQIDSGSYNWMSVKSSSDVTGWAQYDSFSHATEKFGDLISGSQYYFKANKYSVNEIGPVYCDAEWSNSVNEFMARLYNSVGIQIDTSNQVTTTTQNTATNSVDLVVAGWSTERTEVKTVEYEKNNTGTQEIKVKDDKTDTGDVYTFYEVSINYQNMLSKYSMPAGFLWSLLVMGENTQFTLKLADLAINHTNIVIEAQDSNSITVNEDIQKYKHKKDITKTIVAKDSTEITKDYTYTADIESSITTTVTTKYSNTRLNLVYAKTWVATYKANYKNTVNSVDTIDRNWYENTEWQELEDVNLGTEHRVANDPNNDEDYSDIKQEFINSITWEQCSGKFTSAINAIKNNNNALHYLLQNTADSNVQIILDNIVPYIYNYVKGQSTQSAINNINNAIDTLWNNNASNPNILMYSKEGAKNSLKGTLNSIASKMKTLKSAEMDITKYKVENKCASNIQTVNTNTFISAGTVVKERTEIDEENNFVEYFNNSGRAKEYILEAPSWLYEMLESQEKTANMIDLFKYLLYKSTDTDYGVTEFDFSIIDTSGFNSMGSGFMGDTVEEKLWWALLDAGYTKEAAAGAMGNTKAESNFNPKNLETSFEIGKDHSIGYTDETYTEAINNGTYKREQFISDHYKDNCGAGYGLAQWTYYTRKAGLYDYAKEKGVGIEDVNMQIEYLLAELSPSGGANGKATYQLYPFGGYTADDWEQAQTPEEAAEIYCWLFEKPGTPHMENRRKYAREIYDKYKDKERPTFKGKTYTSAQGYVFPHYIQQDYKEVGSYCRICPKSISQSGCGPTSMAIILAGLKGDPSITPVTFIENLRKQWPKDQYHYDHSQGSGWEINNPEFLKKYYGVTAVNIGSDAEAMEALNNGYPVLGGEKGHILALVPASEEHRKQGYVFYILDCSNGNVHPSHCRPFKSASEARQVLKGNILNYRCYIKP